MTRPPSRAAVFHGALRNPDLRRVEIAFAGFNAAEWSTWIAIVVYAYTVAGPTAVGVLVLVMLVPSAVVAPIAAQLGDRLPRRRVLVLGYALQAATMGATGLTLLLQLPSIPIYALATLAAMSVTVTRPAQGSLLPELARSPEELVAANALSGMIESISIFAGPVLTGLLLRWGSPGIVWVLMGAIMLGSTLLVMRIRTADPTESVDAPQETAGMLSSTLAGIRTLGRLKGPRLVVSLMFGLSVELGALDVLFVVLAFQVLGTGRAGAGFLYAAIGAGGVAGLLVTATLVGRTHLSRHFLAGIAVWGVALALIGAEPTTIFATLFLAFAGAGRNLMDVAGRTLLQRAVPNAVLSRVLGVLEGLYMVSMGIGAVLAPPVIVALGVRGTFIAAGLALVAVTAISLRPLSVIDRIPPPPARYLERARALTLFAPLDPPVLEGLAAAFRALNLPASAVIIREGEQGKRFYVVDQGEVSVLKKGVEINRLGAGDYFGEISLLRSIPTTATVIASTDVQLLTLDPQVWIAAITGNARSRRAAEAVVTRRLLR